jgi:superfamily II DNA or RNA helicase
MACALIARQDVPTLVLVDRKPLVEQWRERLAEHLDLDAGDIGVIGGGRSKPTGIVDVAMIQSVRCSTSQIAVATGSVLAGVRPGTWSRPPRPRR